MNYSNMSLNLNGFTIKIPSKGVSLAQINDDLFLDHFEHAQGQNLQRNFDGHPLICWPNIVGDCELSRTGNIIFILRNCCSFRDGSFRETVA